MTGGRLFRELQSRLERASKLEFGLDLANVASIAYQFWLSIWLASVRIPTNKTGAVISPVYGWAFVAATAYSFLHRVWLKDLWKHRKWRTEEVRRGQALAVAVSRLAAAVRRGDFRPGELDSVERGLLGAMKSELEAIVGDPHGIYVNVNLMVLDPTNAARL